MEIDRECSHLVAQSRFSMQVTETGPQNLHWKEADVLRQGWDHKHIPQRGIWTSELVACPHSSMLVPVLFPYSIKIIFHSYYTFYNYQNVKYLHLFSSD